jgi:hypothetical protein
VLLLLHKVRRSTEDRASLLLVAALFWTGPMAATIEVTAFRPDLGACLAAGACLIALAEMRLTCGWLGLRLTLPGQLMGAACPILLTVAPPFLKVPASASGTNELFLYAAWWVLSGIALICLPVASVYRRRKATRGHREHPSCGCHELTFLTMTVIATAVHLVGMNHAFFCHAALLYASPLIIAVSAAGMELLILAGKRDGRLVAAVGALPVVAILLTLRPFEAEVPVVLLPWWLRDPMLIVSLAAGAAWLFGYFRHRFVALLHVGNAALCLGVYRMLRRLTDLPVTQGSLIPAQDLWTVALYVAAAYLVVTACLRRSRREALLALVLHLAAVILLVWERIPADRFITGLAVGWSILIGLHLETKRPGLLFRLATIAFLAIGPWTRIMAPPLPWLAGVHTVAMILVLFLAGQLWRWTHYRLVAVVLVAGHALVFTERWVLHGAHLLAAVLVGGGFAVLIGGALISWHKERLLHFLRAENLSGRSEQEGE